MISLPLLTTGSVFHLGTLDPAAQRFASYEGHCLSVSRVPHAWCRIAKLGGLPLWEIRSSPLTFIDALRVAKTKTLRRMIEQWAIWNGFAETALRFRAWHTDEDGAFGYSMHRTEAEARAEVEDDDIGPSGCPAVQPVAVVTGTPQLASLTRMPAVTSGDAFDAILILWGERTQPDLDGVWWSEHFDPEALSAPRGGLFPHRLACLERIKQSLEAVPDDEESAALHRTRRSIQPL